MKNVRILLRAFFMRKSRQSGLPLNEKEKERLYEKNNGMAVGCSVILWQCAIVCSVGRPL